MGAISGMTLARKSRYCPCTGWNFHPLSISVPQSPSQRFHRYSHKMLLTKILQKDPYPEHILLGKVARCAGCLLVQRVRLEIAFSSVPMPV